jgi:hypothetical protein
MGAFEEGKAHVMRELGGSQGASRGCRGCRWLLEASPVYHRVAVCMYKRTLVSDMRAIGELEGYWRIQEQLLGTLRTAQDSGEIRQNTTIIHTIIATIEHFHLTPNDVLWVCVGVFPGVCPPFCIWPFVRSLIAAVDFL